jgi:hypothetical protein
LHNEPFLFLYYCAFHGGENSSFRFFWQADRNIIFDQNLQSKSNKNRIINPVCFQVFFTKNNHIIFPGCSKFLLVMGKISHNAYSISVLEKGLNSFKFYHLSFALSFNHITNKDKWLYKNQYLKGYLQELVKLKNT